MPKNILFLSTFKKAKKWPNGQTILFLANSFKNSQMATLKFSPSNLNTLSDAML